MLRQCDGKNCFACLTDFGPLCHKTQPVEIHVGAAGNRDQRFPFEFVFSGVLFGACERKRARRLEHAAGILKNIFDGGTDGISVDQNVVVNELPSETKGLDSHLFDGGAIRKESHIGQGDTTSRFHAAHHGIGVDRLNTDHFDLWTYLFDIGRNPADKPPPTNGDKNCLNWFGMLTQNLHPDGALTSNDIRVIKGVNKSQLLFFFKCKSVTIRIGKAVTVQHDFCAERANSINFDAGGRGGHDDDGLAAEPFGRQRNALGMVARGGCDDASRERSLGQVGHLVIGTT